VGGQQRGDDVVFQETATATALAREPAIFSPRLDAVAQRAAKICHVSFH
jgi:hypothetical protein